MKKRIVLLALAPIAVALGARALPGAADEFCVIVTVDGPVIGKQQPGGCVPYDGPGACVAVSATPGVEVKAVVCGPTGPVITLQPNTAR